MSLISDRASSNRESSCVRSAALSFAELADFERKGKGLLSQSKGHSVKFFLLVERPKSVG